jgi:putative ABC transport system permease protein
MINPPDNPARLSLPADWRVLGFGLALTLGVTLLFGLAPALRASAVKPASALKGGEDPHSRRRLMHALIAVQVAFCFLVLSSPACLWPPSTGCRISPPAFPPNGCSLSIRSRNAPSRRSLGPGGRTSAHGAGCRDGRAGRLAAAERDSWNGRFVDGAPPSEDLAYFLNVSPGWIDAMKIPLIDGRDFRAGDTYPGVGHRQRSFRQGNTSTGGIRWKVVRESHEGPRLRRQIVGLVRDARYRTCAEPILPVAYVPFRRWTRQGRIAAVGPGRRSWCARPARTRWRWRPSCAGKCRARGPNSA